MINEVGTILQGADVYAVVFDIDTHNCTRRAMRAIEVDGRQVWAGAGNSGGLLIRLHGAASSCEEQQESREGAKLIEELDHCRIRLKVGFVVDHRCVGILSPTGAIMDTKALNANYRISFHRTFLWDLTPTGSTHQSLPY